MISMKIGIVGCGINGSYLSWKLSKEHDVVVFEKKKTLGKDVCSGLVSERLWNFIPKSKKLIKNRIDELVIHFPKKDVKLKFFPKMFVLNRKNLDNYVVSLARKNGAEIYVNSEVKRVYHVKGMRPQVSVSGKIFEFDYLIGCDGYFSVVRKSLGIKAPKFRLGIYTYVNKRTKSNTVDVYPTKDGFCWKIPRKTKIEYGILEKSNVAKKIFSKFCGTRRIKPKKTYSYVVPHGLIKPQKGRIALCGDVIGLTKPWSGGGIIWSLIADDILLKSFPNLTKYEERLLDYFEPKIFFSGMSDKVVRFFANTFPSLLPKETYFDGDWIF